MVTNKVILFMSHFVYGILVQQPEQVKPGEVRCLKVPQQEFWEDRGQTSWHSMEHALSPRSTFQLRPGYLWVLGRASGSQGQVLSGSSHSLQPCLWAGTHRYTGVLPSMLHEHVSLAHLPSQDNPIPSDLHCLLPGPSAPPSWPLALFHCPLTKNSMIVSKY